MLMTRIKSTSAVALACIFTIGGLQAFGRQLAGRGDQAGANPSAEDRQAALTRSFERLESELDESLQRNAEMRKDLRVIRSGLESLRASVPPSPAGGTSGRLAVPINADSASAVNRLADALKRHPGELREDVGWGAQLYMMDLVKGETTLLFDEPIPGHFATGYATWSHDGSRIVFETAGGNWPRGELMAIDLSDGNPSLIRLGEGNRPTFSPDGQRVAFTLFPSAEAGAAGGVWMVRADGSDRHRVGVFRGPF